MQPTSRSMNISMVRPTAASARSDEREFDTNRKAEGPAPRLPSRVDQDLQGKGCTARELRGRVSISQRTRGQAAVG